MQNLSQIGEPACPQIFDLAPFLRSIALKKFISSHPGFSDTLQKHDNILSDHSSYLFPLRSGTTDNIMNDSLP